MRTEAEMHRLGSASVRVLFYILSIGGYRQKIAQDKGSFGICLECAIYELFERIDSAHSNREQFRRQTRDHFIVDHIPFLLLQ
jgi:hypothetical protein